jgi:hypothetical protein
MRIMRNLESGKATRKGKKRKRKKKVRTRKKGQRKGGKRRTGIVTVALEVLANLDSLLDDCERGETTRKTVSSKKRSRGKRCQRTVVEVLRDLGSETVGLQDTEDLVTGDGLDLGNTAKRGKKRVSLRCREDREGKKTRWLSRRMTPIWEGVRPLRASLKIWSLTSSGETKRVSTRRKGQNLSRKAS